MLLRLRFDLDLYVNHRPAKLLHDRLSRCATPSAGRSTARWCARTPRACTWA
ncbi:hypothetical protein NKH18_39710 [Streptomyces sp. M10(2022)]